MRALWIFLLISMAPMAIRGHFEFNNVVCLVRDRMFMDFEYCYLKSVNRTYKYLSLKTKVFHLPVDNCETRFQLRMRENRRLLYNFDFKVDSCKFLRDRKHVVANWVYQTFAPYSNINHTCPYDHDIVLDKLPVQHLNKLVQSIIPDGRYMMNSTWMVAGIPRTDVILYFTKS
ncbi:uncharacterized protein LOC6736137 [Drosophila simulans]|uniref:GD11898 n=1 Tax=Drosophila simulans TaxID=7240 RepID=B4QCK6_DROSI|nr:uncharacterized protein LOC6736137 [Drosophila simulans]EDX08622.1 GD11898 [Drosophila simulans]KMY96442.1 uncharacterized protein Dsimw501_GD11898, isoform A [Drosophila simulans]